MSTTYILHVYSYYRDRGNSKPQIRLKHSLPEVQDCIATHLQLAEYLDRRGTGYHNDAFYECYRYENGVQQERQWRLEID
ncbi:hypothetical protein P9VFCI_085 [Rhizobium phage P9VFCI]|uniref:Uncharacterized protein n=1 Tax=Rhizobium phage P9VFCI TaxID=2763531 RepID=A0A7G7WXN7_9CAUD|nr:hypothetical protein PP937_gp085 [Rhizobium phage P9VFCI]QNH71981.1 hypothetical protein P9VFCI_085 [Rhizobium phage P9VFCI]